MQDRCPNCGACPHCGQPAPYQPWWGVTPPFPEYPTVPVFPVSPSAPYVPYQPPIFTTPPVVTITTTTSC